MLGKYVQKYQVLYVYFRQPTSPGQLDTLINPYKNPGQAQLLCVSRRHARSYAYVSIFHEISFSGLMVRESACSSVACWAIPPVILETILKKEINRLNSFLELVLYHLHN